MGAIRFAALRGLPKAGAARPAERISSRSHHRMYSENPFPKAVIYNLNLIACNLNLPSLKQSHYDNYRPLHLPNHDRPSASQNPFILKRDHIPQANTIALHIN